MAFFGTASLGSLVADRLAQRIGIPFQIAEGLRSAARLTVLPRDEGGGSGP